VHADDVVCNVQSAGGEEDSGFLQDSTGLAALESYKSLQRHQQQQQQQQPTLLSHHQRSPFRSPRNYQIYVLSSGVSSVVDVVMAL
jgi:hypothetical protein